MPPVFQRIRVSATALFCFAGKFSRKTRENHAWTVNREFDPALRVFQDRALREPSVVLEPHREEFYPATARGRTCIWNVWGLSLPIFECLTHCTTAVSW